MLLGAIEAGGTKFVLAVGNQEGDILDKLTIPTERPDQTIPKIVAYFKDKGIKKLGLGAFGPIDLN